MSTPETLILSRQELIDFAKEIYSDSCAGYMDLKDTTCQSKVDKLFDQKKSFIKRDYQQSQFNWETGGNNSMYNTVTFSTSHYGLDMSGYTLDTSNLSVIVPNDLQLVPSTVLANETNITNFLNPHSIEGEDSNTSF
jgi:hypothetical protein